MFCAPGYVFDRAECVGSRFNVLCAWTHFCRSRGRRVPFSSFALPDTFLTVQRASGHVFIFCAPFSYFALPDSFLTETRVPGPVFIFYAPRVVSCGTEGVSSRFHILRSRTLFRRYRGRQVPFLCFARPDSYSVVPRASALVFIFCASGLVFGGTEDVISCFHILGVHTRFRRYRVRPVPFSCFALPYMFSSVPSASGHIFMLSSSGLVFGGPDGDGSRFEVLRAGTSFRRNRGRRVPFLIFCTPGHVFGGTADIRSRFPDLCSRHRFRQY
jgi:hypothetical protein